MTENSDVISIKNKIWLTSKTKMQAEKRYTLYNNVAHIFLCGFSLMVIGLAVFAKYLPANVPIDAYTIWFSIFVIVITTVVFGFRFGETAALHRECYLRLQKLYDSKSSVKSVKDSYHDIISSYPNHSDKDYDRLILSRTFFNSDILMDPNNNSLTWNYWMLAKFSIFQITIWSCPLIVFAVSLGSIFWLW